MKLLLNTPAGMRLRFALVAALIVLAVSWVQYVRSVRSDPLEPVQSTRLIDLNQADRAELTLIPGIGPQLADAIVKHREYSGPIDRLETLDRIRGLGPKKIRTIAQWVLLDSLETSLSSSADRTPSFVVEAPVVEAPIVGIQSMEAQSKEAEKPRECRSDSR